MAYNFQGFAFRDTLECGRAAAARLFGTALCVNWSCLLLRRIKHLMASPGFILSPSAEIEAKEACTWLRAAGFPQYAQLYEGNRQTETDRPCYHPKQQ